MLCSLHRKALLGLLPAFLLFSCDNNTSTSVDTTPTFSEVYQVLNLNCVSCHGTILDGGTQIDFTTQERAYQTLTSLNASGNTAQGVCTDVPIVDAANINNSYLAAVFSDAINQAGFDGQPNCQPISHIDEGYLSDAEIQDLLDWIRAGARND